VVEWELAPAIDWPFVAGACVVEDTGLKPGPGVPLPAAAGVVVVDVELGLDELGVAG
jgi:hypothetical protein